MGLIMKTKGQLKTDEVYEYIKQTILKQGYPPTVRDICQAVDLKSTSSAHTYLERLEREGRIRRDPAKSRCIELVNEDYISTRRELVNVPMVGTVTAGQPILAVESIDDYFPIPADMLPNAETFMLRVKGESMINVGIFDGDQILVEKCSTARNGDIVVALIEDSATVKTYYKENGYYRLQPENDTMEPIIVKEVEILGVVIGLFRLFR